MMNTEKLTRIARPYVAAAFEFGQTHHSLASWQQFLTAASLVVNNEQVKKLLHSPQISKNELTLFCCDVLSKILTAEQENFLKLLGEHDRLVALPEIATLFAQAVAEHEKTVNVEVWSAVTLPDDFKQTLIQALTKKLKRKVHLQDKVDADLLGGVLVRAGDVVYDGSVRGKLNRLLDTSLR